MTIRIIRKRYYIAVEGEGEQSFVKWLNQLCDEKGLHVHLDCQPLNGGGYRTMLEKAVHYQQRNERRKAKTSILLIDEDRAEHDDSWSLPQLKSNASKHKIHICVQSPNQEGLLLRMMPGKETLRPHAAYVQKELRSLWPEYRKPVDTRRLAARFSIEDLLRVARIDMELNSLLALIGLKYE